MHELMSIVFFIGSGFVFGLACGYWTSTENRKHNRLIDKFCDEEFIKRSNEQFAKRCDDFFVRLSRLEMDNAQMQETFSWLLGEQGEFPRRENNDGAYY